MLRDAPVPNLLLALTTIVLASICSGSFAADESSARLAHEMKVQRACEVAIWAMPAVAIYDIELSIQRDLGGKPGDIAYLSQPMTSRHGFLTANDVTPYVTSGLSCADDPLVIEVPAAGDKASFFGSVVDAWQTPIVDVGPTGADEGQGAKFLFVPPGYEGEIPEDGYLVYYPRTFGIHFAFRPIARNGGTHEDQSRYARTLKVYRLSQADNPPEDTFIDAYPKRWNTLPVYDMTFFQDMNTVVQREPVLERDKAMMALLASLGIEKGREFAPDPATEKALLEGLQRAYAWMQDYFIHRSTVPWWDDCQWQVWNFAEGQPEAGFPYVTDDRVLIDERAGGSYFWITYLPKKLGGGTFYLTGLRDSDGNLLNGEDTYRLNVPADTPAKDFWSVIVYSMKTKGFVEDVERVGLSSQVMDTMELNPDGSVDVYFAPKAPEGREANWIPTWEDFFLLFRLYGPDKPLFDKSWILADIEKVNP